MLMSKVINNSFKTKTIRNFYYNDSRLFGSLSTPRKNKEKAQQDEPNWETAKPFNTIPGPSRLQLLVENLPGGKYYKLSIHKFQTKLREEYGLLVKIPGLLGRSDIVMTYNPSDYEKIFRNEGQWPERRGLFTFVYYRRHVRPEIFNNMGGLLTEQGEKWGKIRTTVNQVFLPPRTVNMHIPVVDIVTKEFLNKIISERDGNNEVPSNFIELMNRWSFESVGCITLDQRLGVLSKETEKAETKRLFYGLKRFMVLSYELDYLPSIWKYYKTPKFNELMKIFDDMTYTLKKYVDEAIKKYDQASVEGSDAITDATVVSSNHHTSILASLLKINRHLAMVMCMDMIIGGVDTTSQAAIALMYQLAKNPDKQELLRKEIIKILPNIDSPLTPDTLKYTPYLRACFKESMRLLPVSPGNARAMPKNIVLQGYQIPKGIDIVMTTILLRDPENYPEPEKFLPERWIKKTCTEYDTSKCPSASDANPFVYLPFGFGVRSCIGKRFAEMEIGVLISRILRQYKIEYNYGPIKYVNGLFNVPTGDIKFKLTKL